MIESPSATTPMRPPLKPGRAIIYVAVIILALLLVWQGPRWFNQHEGGEVGPTAASSISFPNLTNLRSQMTNWQKLWQDSRFTELQSLTELLPSSGGNLTPFEKQIPPNTAPNPR